MDDLIEEHMGLVVKIVDQFKPKNITERDDMMDAGRIGLWKALKKYDKSKGTISTYAWNAIRWSIIHERKKNQSTTASLNSNLFYLKNNKDSVEDIIPDYLPERIKEIIILRSQGYKFREIGEKFGMTSNEVQNQFYKTIKYLKDIHE